MKQKYVGIALQLFYWIAVLFVLIFVLPKVLVFFMPLVIGLIIACIANPLVKLLEKKLKIKRRYSTVLMIVLVIGLVVLAVYGIIKGLAIGVGDFIDDLPVIHGGAEVELYQAAVSLQNLLRKIPFLSGLDMSGMGELVNGMLDALVEGMRQPTVTAIGDIAKQLPNILVYSIMGFLATYFFIADGEKIISGLKAKLPEEFQKSTMVMYGQVIRAIAGYFKAQFKIMGIIYVIIVIGLLLLKVRYAWLIGAGIAVLDMLPVFGTGTVLIPWAAIKLFSGNYMTALGMIVLYLVALVAHQLIQPKLVGDSVGMGAFSTLIYMFAGYKFGGVVGLIIAIPVGMVIQHFYEAGAFDRLFWCIGEIGRDMSHFRNVDAWMYPEEKGEETYGTKEIDEKRQTAKDEERNQDGEEAK